MLPPAAATRSRSPVSPFPGGALLPMPSSVISIEDGDRRTAHERARECRTMLVSPSRTTQPWPYPIDGDQFGAVEYALDKTGWQQEMDGAGSWPPA
jgi:hypothetical protein